MAGSKGRRTIVEALDDLTAELRIANAAAVLRMGSGPLEYDPEKSTNETTRARQKRRNALRAIILDGLGLER